MRKLSRKFRNSLDAEFSLSTCDDPALNDSHPMDNRALSSLLHGGGALMDDYICRLPRWFRWGVIWLPFEPLSGARRLCTLSFYIDPRMSKIKEHKVQLYSYKLDPQTVSIAWKNPG